MEQTLPQTTEPVEISSAIEGGTSHTIRKSQNKLPHLQFQELIEKWLIKSEAKKITQAIARSDGKSLELMLPLQALGDLGISKQYQEQICIATCVIASTVKNVYPDLPVIITVFGSAPDSLNAAPGIVIESVEIGEFSLSGYQSFPHDAAQLLKEAGNDACKTEHSFTKGICSLYNLAYTAASHTIIVLPSVWIGDGKGRSLHRVCRCLNQIAGHNVAVIPDKEGVESKIRKAKRYEKVLSIVTEEIGQLSTEQSDSLHTAWFEQNGRRDTGSKLRLVIGLENPTISHKTFDQILDLLNLNPSLARAWAEDFGGTLVMYSNDNSLTLEKSPIIDRILLLSTTELIKMDSLFTKVQDLPADCNAISLNERNVTLEGLIVEMVHLLDELVWTRYQALSEELEPQTDHEKDNLYERAIKEIQDEGYFIHIASTEQIINMHLMYPETSIRIYGSGAISSINPVMGLVSSSHRAQAVLQAWEIPVKAGEIEESLTAEKEKVTSSEIAVSITLAKPLHLGHLLLLSTADLIRSVTGEVSITLINNDTGPRVVATVESIATKLDMPLDEVQAKLVQGLIPFDAIVECYRQRNKPLNPQLPIYSGIFSLMEDKVIQLLSECGYSVQIKRDSELNTSLVETTLNTPWIGSGFLPFSSSEDLTVLVKDNVFTDVGCWVAHGLSAISGKIILVDSSEATKTASTVLNALGINSIQINGAGAGIAGKIGSGTGGELPTAHELSEIYGEDLNAFMKYIIWTRTQTTGPLPFYDFTPNVHSDLQTLWREYQDWKKDNGEEDQLDLLCLHKLRIRIP
jgi:hypothetical protein